MSTVQVYYDGWVTLPMAALRKFNLATGASLEVEFAGDAIVLRPARGPGVPGHATAEPAAATPEEQVASEEPAAAADPIPAPAPAVRRGPGRPRKVPTDTALPPDLKTRGRRKAAPPSIETQAL